MKRFNSRFAAIQRIRQQKEKIAAAEMANARQALQEAENDLLASQQELNATLTEIQELMYGAYGAANLKSGLRQSEIGQLAVMQKQQQKLRVQKEVDDALQRRTLAFQELKTVDEAAQREKAVYRKQQMSDSLMIQMENFRPASTSPNTASTTSATAEDLP